MIEQMYAAAVRSSDLSVKAHKMGHADVIAAFGMSRSVLGLALLRLHTEWDGSEVRDGREVSSVEIRALRSFPVVRLGLMDWLMCLAWTTSIGRCRSLVPTRSAGSCAWR